MARVTVEDCVDKVPNRFDLVMLASHRARTISTGAELTIAGYRRFELSEGIEKKSDDLAEGVAELLG